jgi:hypothetical protein
MIGYKEDELENNFNEWEKRVHPEDLEKSKNDLDQIVSRSYNTRTLCFSLNSVTNTVL